ncbi:Ig-like domain-containing protein [Brucepastera parasyntrophica]|uniref:Ig-like domain-containing protein n=1 Tax=Brucepastera parasyntrophica TaxID=2880008 RepID=UPI002108C732|nr:Ig-like domain-containing protein [Brucepastera parasyntrophica]ULQ60774.1 Ig-like domain-containing protein [Brucepastera parasyntrophica]
MNKFMKGAGIFILLIMLISLTACQNPFFSDVENKEKNNSSIVKSVGLNSTNQTLYVGQSFQLEATIMPTNAPNQNVSWQSNDDTVVTVDEDGLMTAIKEGSAVITVTSEDGKKKDTCQVTVTRQLIHVEDIALHTISLTVAQNSVGFISATVSPANATDCSLRWSSSHPNIATVVDGAVNGISPGEAIITAISKSNGEIQASCYVTVSESVSVPVQVAFNTQGGSSIETQTVNTGEAIVKPADPTKSGYVFDGWFLTSACVGSPVTFPYTITTGGITLYAKWTDTSSAVAVTGVSLNIKTHAMSVGESVNLQATISPANATNQQITWTSSDTSRASVVNGQVTALAAGSVTITVTTADGNKTDTSSITITAAQEMVTVQFETQGGSSIAAKTIQKNGQLSDPGAPTKLGHRFIGWYTNSEGTGSKITFPYTVTSSITLYAKWEVPVTGVTLNKTATTIAAGGTETLTVTIAPSDATIKTVQWRSADPSVATVDSTGTVTGEQAGGSTTIIVRTDDGSYEASCTVTISGSVAATVTFDSKGGSAVSAWTGQTGDQIAKPANPTQTGYTFDGWYIDEAYTGNPVAFPYTVSGTITLYAKWTEAASTIAVTGVSLDKTTHTMGVGESVTLAAAIAPANATNQQISWTSSDTSKATVANGQVTALAAGTVTITVTTDDGSKTAACTVTVKTKSTVTFNSAGGSDVAALTVYTGDTIDRPANPTLTGSTFAEWYTSGAYTGEPVSFPYTVSGNVTLYAKWIVNVSSVTLDRSTLEIRVGDEETLAATILPSNAANKTVTWTSGSPSVATVVNGLVKGISAGTATITAASVDGNRMATCTVTVAEALVLCATPAISATSGTTATSFILTTATSGADIYYTTDGTAPTTSSTKYTAGFTLAAGTHTVKAIAVKAGMSNSNVFTGTVTVSAAYDGIIIFVKNSSAPTIWVWEQSGKEVSKNMGGTYPGSAMSAATSTYMVAPSGWYMYQIPAAELTTPGKALSFILNGGSNIVTTKTATFWYDNGTYSDTDPTASNGNGSDEDLTIYVKSSSAPKIWMWENSGKQISLNMGYTWPGATMTAASGMNDPTGWYMFTAPKAQLTSPGKAIYFQLNSGGNITTTKTATFWYDNGTFYDADPTTPSQPVVPTVTISPASGTVALTGNITVTLTNGGSAITSASVTVNGSSYTYANFVSNVLTVPVSTVTSSAGTAISVSVSATNAVGTSTGSASLTTAASSDLTIYIKAGSAPTIWVWEEGGKSISTNMGYTWPGTAMDAASNLNYSVGWYQFVIPEAQLTSPRKTISFILNSGSDVTTAKTATFWYDSGTYYDADPTIPPAPEAPTVTITPSSGEIALNGSIKIALTNGYANITDASVTVNSSSYTYSDFTNNLLTVPVSGITSTEGATINVNASVTNDFNTSTTRTASAVYTTVDRAVDVFTWDNALVYFVLTDRFYDGDSSNNNSYNRRSGGYNNAPALATFQGGDIKGMTEKLDYLEDLGVNAIWITAPYEQIHGWVSGKDKAFPHYSFHGYYALDWTYMDKNVGTIEEFRTFVNTAHSKGIRVVMDVVINHTGYNNTEDMITYNFGATSQTQHGWLAQVGGVWDANDGNNWSDSAWGNWWGEWVRAFEGKFGFAPEGSGELTGSLAGLPDVVTERTSSVTIPTFLKQKWAAETAAAGYGNWILPAASSLRADNLGAPADYLIKWLAAWVEEFGIDGFRCDTAKHVDRYRWGQLKSEANAALQRWRNSSRASGDARYWDEDFWMTGEDFGFTIGSMNGSDYYTTGGFDSMINFSFNGTSGGTGRTPTTSDWESYASTINSSSGRNMLSYVSSHDTGLHRPGDQKNLGTMLVLLPGGVQIYYGDETARPNVDGLGDADMATRGFMNWSAENGDVATHWKKVGSFRKNHPAVGAGTQTKIETNTYGRVYSKDGFTDKVVIRIGASGSTSVNVGTIFSNGTLVRNAYDGTTAAVSGGAVTFTASNGVILIEAAD